MSYFVTDVCRFVYCDHQKYVTDTEFSQVMELETQVQVSTNQLRRQDEESKRIRDDLEASQTREKEMANKAREQQHRYETLQYGSVPRLPFLVV